MFESDKSIKSSSQDIIGRKYFARSVAKAILSYEAKNELVLGLFGEWGSGKTSLLNLTIEGIEELSKDVDNKPIIISFNPWNFSDQNQLITQYFSILSGVLKRKDHSAELIAIGEKLEEYSDIFEPLSYIPVLSPFTSIAKTGLKLSSDALKFIGKNKKGDLNELRNELNSLLISLNKKIIVLIDDIDRLTPQEIRQIFQLVKSIADFPNTIYLLSFDKNVVLNALKEAHNGFENEYLEKIIQVPFEIPPISKQDLHQFLFKQIDRIIADLPQNEFDLGYWGNMFHSGIKYYFKSLRDVNRFINILSFNYSLVKGTVNVIDLISITTLQVFHAELYYSIRSNKELFAGYREASTISFPNNEKKAIKLYSEIIPAHKDISKDKLEKLLRLLFPKLESVFSGSFYDEGWSGEWRKKSRICSEEYFDAYFRLTIDKSLFSNNEIKTILSTAGDYDIFRTNMLLLNQENRIEKFLELLEDYTGDAEVIPDKNIQNIVSVLMDIGDLIPEKVSISMFEIDTPMRLLRMFHQLSHRFNEFDLRFNLLKTAIENSKESIYTIVHEIGVQDQQHSKLKNGVGLSLEQVTVNPEQLGILHELAVTKIEEWAKKPELVTHDHLGGILYRWKASKGLDIVKQYVEKLITTDKGIVNFVRAFLVRSVSYGSGEYGGKVSWSINLRDIEEFIEIRIIEERLKKLNETELNKFTEKERLAIQTFWDFYNNKRKFNT